MVEDHAEIRARELDILWRFRLHSRCRHDGKARHGRTDRAALIDLQIGLLLDCIDLQGRIGQQGEIRRVRKGRLHAHGLKHGPQRRRRGCRELRHARIDFFRLRLTEGIQQCRAVQRLEQLLRRAPFGRKQARKGIASAGIVLYKARCARDLEIAALFAGQVGHGLLRAVARVERALAAALRLIGAGPLRVERHGVDEIGHDARVILLQELFDAPLCVRIDPFVDGRNTEVPGMDLRAVFLLHGLPELRQELHGSIPCPD